MSVVRARVSQFRFNLAIEMLFISGVKLDNGFVPELYRFNLAIEMLFMSGSAFKCGGSAVIAIVSISQSRGFSVQAHLELLHSDAYGVFQSRNREAFHFRSVPAEPLTRLG